ncbi:hypothetical protein F4824DRAFT_269579 [Ustulina deusta]|nr:hypothetical protein F4824DRAFT_269579 [Ustulina deusta]
MHVPCTESSTTSWTMPDKSTGTPRPTKSASSRLVHVVATTMCRPANKRLSTWFALVQRSFRKASWMKLPAWDIRDAFAAMKREQPLTISTVMKEVGFPAITLDDIERWANPDGTFGPGTKTHDASDLSADETLHQLKRCAITALTKSNPGRLGKVLLALEAQQAAFAASWSEYHKIDQEKSRWVSTIRVKTGPGPSDHMEWWNRAINDDTRGADQELVPAHEARVANVLVPFIAAWRAGSRAHSMSRAVCKDCP